MIVTNAQNYKVTTENGNERVVTFTETDHPTAYGNGKAVVVENHGNGERNFIDCRYISGYKFETVCENWIKDYYGENLLTFSKIEV